jgi:hypothetical protein
VKTRLNAGCRACIDGRSWCLVAEDDLQLTWRRAFVHKSWAIMGIRKRGRARMLEELREARSPTRLRTVVVVPTAQLVRTERLAPTLARHDRPVTGRRPDLQPVGTRGEQVGATANNGAVALALVRGHSHGHVKAIDKADTVGGEVVLAVVEAELSQRGGGGAA